MTKHVFRPQLAKLVDAVPTGEEWTFEPKFDGYRIGALSRKGSIALFTRNGKDWSAKFSKLVTELESILPANTLIDGELVAERRGRVSFQALQRTLLEEAEPADLHYYVFDALMIEGEDVRKLPLRDRRKLLRALIARGSRHVHLVQPLKGERDRLLKSAVKAGYEGVICKRVSAPYTSGREGGWLKVKDAHREEFAIIGYTQHSKASSAVGALLLGLAAGDRGWVYCGKVGTGFSDSERRRLFEDLHRPGRKPVVLNDDLLPRDKTLISPRRACEIAFTEWTSDGMLRHPSYTGIRRDKSAADISLLTSSHPLRKRLERRA